MELNNKKLLNEYTLMIEKQLKEYTKDISIPQASVLNAMEHSLSAGGKRIRPILVLEFYKLCCGKGNVLHIACAIEMIHTFSLIHDDLPCMDDDDFRRGKPSCHKAYGEAVALLAGDALATIPYEIITSEAINHNISFESAIKVIQELSKSVGVSGMIGGQVIDIEYEAKPITKETLILLDNLKTGALIKASCTIGCILANASEEQIAFAQNYAEKIGLAFQIIDDILDVTSTFEKLGKPLNSDEKKNKTTYVTLFGLEKAKEIAEKLTNEALCVLNNFENNSFIVELTKMLLERNN